MKRNKLIIIVSIFSALLSFAGCQQEEDELKDVEILANEFIPKLNGYWQMNNYNEVLYFTNDSVVYNKVRHSFKRKLAYFYESDSTYMLFINDEHETPYSLLHVFAKFNKDKVLTFLSIEDYSKDDHHWLTDFKFICNSKTEFDEVHKAYKDSLIRELSNTKWLLDDSRTGSPDMITFLDDSIVLENNQYPLDFNSNIFLPDEVDSHAKKLYSEIYFSVNNKYYGFEGFEGNYSILRYYTSNTTEARSYIKDASFTGGGAGGSQSDSSVEGFYSYTGATGSEMDGSITLADGSWTYSGSKTNMAAKNGKYTENDSKVTLKWTASGYDVEETFTLTDMGEGKVKWVSDNAYTSTFLSMVFGIAGKTEVVLGKE